MLTYPHGFVGGGLTFDDDTVAFIARTTGLNLDTKVALDTFIRAIKEDGIWDNIDFINLLLPSSTDTNAKANTLLNIRQNAFNGTIVGVSYTFSQTTGFSFARSQTTYIKNGWYSHSTPGNNGEVMRPDKQHIVCYVNTYYDTGGRLWCGYVAPGGGDPLTNAGAYLGDNGSYVSSQHSAARVGYRLMSRVLGCHGATDNYAGGGYGGYENSGGQTTASTQFHIAARDYYENCEFIVNGYNAGNYPTVSQQLPTNSRISAWGLGYYLTLTQFQNYLSHIQTYMTALGIEE